MNIRLLVCFGLLAVCVSPTDSAGLLNLSGILSPLVKLVATLLGVPDYLLQKWATFFLFADFNQNAKLEQADFDLAVDEVAKRHPEVDPARVEFLHTVAVPKAWEAFKRIFPTARVGPLDLLDVILELVNLPNIALNVKPFMDGVFKTSDLNWDGVLNATEYGVLFEARSRPAADGEESFRESDADGDGNVSEKELESCAIDYFIGLMPGKNRCKYFVGPLLTVEESTG